MLNRDALWSSQVKTPIYKGSTVRAIHIRYGDDCFCYDGAMSMSFHTALIGSSALETQNKNQTERSL